MKLKIKIKVLTEGCMPVISEKGDLIDLRAAKNYEFHAPQAGVQYQKSNIKYRDVKFDEQIIQLGVAMQLPKGMMAKLKGRSSLTKKHGIVMACSGEIDNSYCGNNDEWKVNAIAFRATEIHIGDKIAQFEIVPSTKATFWQKLKWLFSSKIEFVEVECLEHHDRGGFGTTGSK